MMATISDFAARHWIVGGIATSLLWFFAGKDSKHNLVSLWRGVGVVILIITCAWAIVEREWLGLAAGIIVLCWEIRTIWRSTEEIKTQ